MRRRLVVLVSATVALVTIAFLVPLGIVVHRLAAERATRPAELATRSLSSVVSLATPATTAEVLTALDPAGALELGVVWPDGRSIGAEITDHTAGNLARRGAAGRYDASDGLLVVVPVVGPDGTTVVHSRVRDAELMRGVFAAWGILGALGVGILAGSVALSARLARRTLASVAELQDTAQRLAEGDLSARALDVEPAELSAVAGALGTLAERVDELLVMEREAAADLSHRLRTPLTPLRIEAEALPPSERRDRLVEQVLALEGAVSEVINLTRGGDHPDEDSSCDLVAVVRERTDFWRALAEDEHRPLSVSLPSTPAVVPLRRREASDLVDVLVDNVLTHTTAGTALLVAVAVTPTAVRLSCEDDGPGFPDLEAVQVRGATSRDGSTGLGLDIARRLANRANARLELGPSPAGGAAVHVVFPRRDRTEPLEFPRPSDLAAYTRAGQTSSGWRARDGATRGGSFGILG